MAPHIPPRLIRVHELGFSTVWGGTTHPPATKCCHDFAGRRLEEDEELLVVAVDGLVIVSMKSKRKRLDVNHQSLKACSGGVCRQTRGVLTRFQFFSDRVT